MLRRITLLVVLLLLAACAPPATRHTFESLPQGDPGSGEKLFAQSNGDAPACSSCHSIDGSPNTGPSLRGIGEMAESRVADERAEEYLFYSIVRPARYMVRGYSNLMYDRYDEQFEAADIADLIAYMLTL